MGSITDAERTSHRPVAADVVAARDGGGREQHREHRHEWLQGGFFAVRGISHAGRPRRRFPRRGQPRQFRARPRHADRSQSRPVPAHRQTKSPKPEHFAPFRKDAEDSERTPSRAFQLAKTGFPTTFPREFAQTACPRRSGYIEVWFWPVKTCERIFRKGAAPRKSWVCEAFLRLILIDREEPIRLVANNSQLGIPPMRFAGIVCLLWLAAASSATAGEEETPFSTLYTTDLLPQGEAELEQSAVWGKGKPGESFNAVEGRTEVEYGWSENFQLSGSALYDWARVRTHTSEAPDPNQDGLEILGPA